MNSDLRPAYEHRESDVVGQIKKVRGHLCVYWHSLQSPSTSSNARSAKREIEEDFTLNFCYPGAPWRTAAHPPASIERTAAVRVCAPRAGNDPANTVQKLLESLFHSWQSCASAEREGKCALLLKLLLEALSPFHAKLKRTPLIRQR